MYVVGLTGGIGSGKSIVATFFNEIGIITYNSDVAARRIMQENKTLRFTIISYFGKLSYKGDRLNTAFIAQKVFNDTYALKKLNSFVHPLVEDDFKSWLIAQKGPYCIKETAILFESGTYIQCHWIISVIASLKLRIQRIKNRSHLNRDQIINRLNYQCSDQEHYSRSTMIIKNNNGLKLLRNKVKNTHNKILDLIYTDSLYRKNFMKYLIIIFISLEKF